MRAVHHQFRFSLWAWLLLLSLSVGCRSLDVPLWSPIPSQGPAWPVECVENVAYDESSEGDCAERRLDVYYPKGGRDCPVLLMIHGGGWVMGDKNCCGLYPAVARFFASRGLVVLCVNYRLSPTVKHPIHVRDLAQAFAWTRNRVATYGGDPGRIFVVGHSAGGHLAALLATDETYLREHGLTTSAVRGVIALSGVYRIPRYTPDYRLGGKSPLAFTLNQLLPIRGESGDPGLMSSLLPGVPLGLSVFGPPFGDDPAGRDAASPVNHVRPGLPPFLLLSAEHDLPSLPGMAEEFHHTLLAHGNESSLLKAAKRNHNSILFSACQENDPVARTMLEFIVRH